MTEETVKELQKMLQTVIDNQNQMMTMISEKSEMIDENMNEAGEMREVMKDKLAEREQRRASGSGRRRGNGRPMTPSEAETYEYEKMYRGK